MNNKTSAKIIITVTFLIILALLIPELFNNWTESGTNPFDYAHITDVDYKAVLVDEPDSEGKLIVTERLTFDIHAASKNNLFWELWRDLPEQYYDGVKVSYKVNSVKQILPDGSEILYEPSYRLYWYDEDYTATSGPYGPGKWYHSEGPYDEENEQYECVFFYVDGLYREQVVFEIEYEMYNAALRYNDCSDLYISLFSESAVNYLKSYNASILISDSDMPDYGNYEVYTYGTNSHTFTVNESDTANPGYHTFSFSLTEDDLKFKPHNSYIEMELIAFGADKSKLADYAPANYYTYDNVLSEIRNEYKNYLARPALSKVIKTILFIICLVLSAIVLFYAFWTRRRIRSKYIFYTPTTDYKYFRDIPSNLDPNFASHLVFIKHRQLRDDSCIYSSILLSLARKGYIELYELNNDVLIRIKRRLTREELSAAYTNVSGEQLTYCEYQYYILLRRHITTGEMLMSQFRMRIERDAENTAAFASNIDKSTLNIGINKHYFQTSGYTKPRHEINSRSVLFFVAGIAVLTIFNAISYQTIAELAYGGWTVLGLSLITASIFLKCISKNMILLTQEGEDEYAKWRGLYNFLNSDTLINDRTLPELALWEQYLVYATAFGIADKVINAIRIRCPEYANSQLLNNSYYRSHSFRHTGSSLRHSVRSGTRAHYSVSSGGGGYGGGGRGGGGGGGGH